MKKQAETLNKASGVLFLFANFSSQVKHIPIFILSSVFNLISLTAYLLAYIVWYAASMLYPDLPRKHEHWFGFAEFKQQYQMAAVLGAISITICLIAPALFLLTSWLYTISNLIWAISECHKKENPFPSDKRYSSARQTAYLRYAILIAANSTQMAMSATLMLLCPTLTIGLFVSSLLIGAGLTIATLYYWGKSLFGTFTPDKVQHSYTKMATQLTPHDAPKPKPTSKPVKTSIIEDKQPTASPIEVNTDTHEPLTHTRAL